MKFIVTGALGHIGSKLVRDSVEMSKAEIIMVDNLSSQRYASLFELPHKRNFKFIEKDLKNLDLTEILEPNDVVIHLAAITDAAASFDKADLVERNNFQLTKKVADACCISKSKLIFISTTSVYGTQNDVVFEDCALSDLKPQSPYAETKLKEESLITKLGNEEGLKFTIFRFGTIYGVSPGMRFHTAVNKFCWQAVMSQPLTIWSTAYDQKRPYLDLDDAVKAVGFLIDKNIFDGELYNILTENLTVRDIVEAIKIYIKEIEINFVDSKIMNQLSYEVSNNKIISKGFNFEGNIKKGIQETISLLAESNSKLIQIKP